MRQGGARRVVRNRVVMDEQDAIGAQMDVQLDAVGAQLDRPCERRHRVFGAFPRGTAMGDDLDRRHGGSSGVWGSGEVWRACGAERFATQVNVRV